MDNCLLIDCPCTSFPRSFARDYKETYRYPPPTTVYGCLLSWVGEEDLMAHVGVQLAIGILGDESSVSRILRKQRHHKFSKTHQGSYRSAQFSKPNFQEVLTDVKITVRVNSEEETASVPLCDRLKIAQSTPEKLSRFGGLSLGESWAMVNGIRAYRPTDGQIRWLVKDQRGLIGLPVWIDRKTSRGTFQRFSLQESDREFSEQSWVTIKPPKTPSQSTPKRRKRYQ